MRLAWWASTERAVAVQTRRLIEEAFGWGMDIGLLRRPKLRGRDKMDFAALLTFTGYNLVRMRNLLAHRPKRAIP